MESKNINVEFPDRNKVLLKCHFHISKEKLWSAISRTEELNQWFMKTDWDFRVGGKFTFEGGWKGWIEDLNEFEFIQLNSSDKSFTRFDLKPVENGIELHLTDQIPRDLVAPSNDPLQNAQPGGPGTHWVGLLAGWEDFLLALESHLANEEIKDHFDGLCLKYKSLLTKKYGSAV